MTSVSEERIKDSLILIRPSEHASKAKERALWAFAVLYIARDFADELPYHFVRVRYWHDFLNDCGVTLEERDKFTPIFKKSS